MDQKSNAINEGMKDLIMITNSLQDTLTPLDETFSIDLPQIAVVGAQSVGKSSVLESIVGKEFLPRGKDIVTRRPLIIQLIPSSKEQAIFLHRSNKIIEDFKEIPKEIEEETTREIGKFKNISSTPIGLKIFSPNVLNLTLVDLPGLTKIPVGDQPSNIDEIVREMVKKFIQSTNCLILAVSTAMQDLATSDALQIAREVDPKGERTIGILTHLDLMAPGTNAQDVLQNKIFPLKKGYIGIINRSQEDINHNRNIGYSIKKEKRFFEENPYYRDMSERMGVKYLQVFLNKELKSHIQVRLPAVRNNLCKRLDELRKKLNSYEEKFDKDNSISCLKYMLQFLTKFIEHFKTSLTGFSENVNLQTVCTGAQLNQALYSEVLKIMKVDLTIDEGNIKKAILNNNAIRTGFLLPQLAFECLCKDAIERYKVPLSSALSVITDLMYRATETSASVLELHPMLKDEVILKVKNKIVEHEEKAKEQILNHINAETSFFNVHHPHFNNGWVASNENSHKQSENKNENQNQSKFSPEENFEFIDVDMITNTSLPLINNEFSEQSQISKINKLAAFYLEIVKTNIEDMLVKYIICFMIKETINYVSTNLSSEIASCDNPGIFLEECPELSEQKDDLKKKLKAIEHALELIKKV